MVHGSIEFEDGLSIKQHDITASILKRIIRSNTINLSEFSDFHNLIARIEYVYSFKDLKMLTSCPSTSILIKSIFLPFSNDIREWEFTNILLYFSRFLSSPSGFLNVIWDINAEIVLGFKK